MEHAANGGSDPVAPISISPSSVSPVAAWIVTRPPSAVNPVISLPNLTETRPTDSSSAPWSADRDATIIGPPSSASGDGTSTRLRTVPSIVRISPRVGAKPRARTVSATPSRRRPAIAFGAIPSPKPSFRALAARSKIRTFQPDSRNAMAAGSSVQATGSLPTGTSTVKTQ